MNKFEFFKLLKEDKFFENPNKHIQHRIPIVQYYLDELADEHINVLGQGVVRLKGTKIEYKDENFTQICSAFEYLKKKFKKEIDKL